MEKVTLGAIIFLLILVAILFIVPDEREQDSQQAKKIELQLYATELRNVHSAQITPDDMLHISYMNEDSLGIAHHFINLKAGNVILIEDEEFEPERILLTDTRHGGLKVTVAKSLNLNLSHSTVKSTLTRQSP